MNGTKIKQQIKQKEKEIKELKEELEKESEKEDKGKWINIGDGREICTKQQFNNMTYEQCEAKAKEKGWEIADYLLLQSLRNAGHGFLKDFWAFVPNPDKITRENNYAAWFDAGSDVAHLYCGWPTDTDASLGVFVLRRKNGNNRKTKRTR